MSEKEKEQAEKVKKLLSSKEVADLIKAGDEVLSTKSIARSAAFTSSKPRTGAEDMLEQLKRDRKRLEKAL